jgi:hypothetical protein
MGSTVDMPVFGVTVPVESKEMEKMTLGKAITKKDAQEAILGEKILKDIREISTAFNVGRKTIKKWCKMSPPPPIIVMGEAKNRRYRTEFYSLKLWLEATFLSKNANS